MKYFRALFSWEPEPAIEGDHSYALPLVECPFCKNSRAVSGLSYPWIIPESIFDTKELGRMKTTKSGGAAGDKDCSWEEFKKYSQKLASKVGNDYLLAPGARIGQFAGKVFDTPDNFVMPAYNTILVNRSVASQLFKDGFELKTFDIKLESKKGVYDFVELWAPPIGWSAGVKFCPECLRGDLGGTKIPTIRCDTIPSDIHLFRLQDCPNYIIFSESLVNTILETGFTGLKFKELSAVRLPPRPSV